MRHPALMGKRDANEPSIIKAQEEAGASVWKLPTGQGLPDLLVGSDMPCPHCGFMFPQNKLEEVKTLKGKLNPTQVKWHDNWKGQKCVVRTPQEALSIIGAGGDVDSRCREAGL